MIPAAPGYFGVIQLCFEAAMQAQELKPPAALVFGASVYSQMVGMIPVLLLGFYFLYRDHLSLSGLQLRWACLPDMPLIPAGSAAISLPNCPVHVRLCGAAGAWRAHRRAGRSCSTA